MALSRRGSGLLAAAGMLLFSAEAMGQVTFRSAYSETLRGGLTMDGWGELSSPTTYASGSFHIRVPRGARVVWARLHTDVVMRNRGAVIVPAGPAGFRREVILGSGASAVTRSLEGAPDYTRAVSFSYGTFATDVLPAVQAIVGQRSSGGEFEIPIRERGDVGPSDGSVSTDPVFEGHSLSVVYTLDYGPRRNVVVYEGNAAGSVVVRGLPLPGPVANRCPAGSALGEPSVLSVALASEYSVCQEDNPLTINGTRVSSLLGGADDWPSDTRTGCAGNIAGLITVGSFGGAEAGAGSSGGFPVGLEGDEVRGAPPSPRRDDELYDARGFVLDGARTIDFDFGGNGDEVLMAMGFQTLVRESDTDADSDGYLDTVEGDCATDTDRDGTPDYLDTDSDNDCLPDRMEETAGRTRADLPGSADANCPSTAPRCDATVGVCQCSASSDCANPIPTCDAFTRRCIACRDDIDCATRAAASPVCVSEGALAGSCVACLPTRTEACPSEAPVCSADNRCVAPTPEPMPEPMPEAGVEPMPEPSPDASSDIATIDATEPDVALDLDGAAMLDVATDLGASDAASDALSDAASDLVTIDAALPDVAIAPDGALDAAADAGADLVAIDTPNDSGATDVASDALADAAPSADAPADASRDVATRDTGVADAPINTPQDVPLAADTGEVTGESAGGCGCRTTRTSPPGASVSLLALALVARRRRRSA